jgi:hypothetical protein
MQIIQDVLKSAGIIVPESTVRGVARKLKASVACKNGRQGIINYFIFNKYHYVQD